MRQCLSVVVTVISPRFGPYTVTRDVYIDAPAAFHTIERFVAKGCAEAGSEAAHALNEKAAAEEERN